MALYRGAPKVAGGGGSVDEKPLPSGELRALTTTARVAQAARRRCSAEGQVCRGSTCIAGAVDGVAGPRLVAQVSKASGVMVFNPWQVVRKPGRTGGKNPPYRVSSTAC